MAQGRQSGLQRPVTPSKELAAITGSAALPRSQVVSKIWDHIKKNNLQNPQNKREIVADDKLEPIFGGKGKVSMFEVNKHLGVKSELVTRDELPRYVPHLDLSEETRFPILGGLWHADGAAAHVRPPC